MYVYSYTLLSCSIFQHAITNDALYYDWWLLTKNGLKKRQQPNQVQFKDLPGGNNENHQRISLNRRCMDHDLQQEASGSSSSFLGGRGRNSPQSARASSFTRFLDHITTHHSRKDSSGWVISSSQRHLPDTTHNTHNKHPCPRWDSNPQSQGTSGYYALDSAATGTGRDRVRRVYTVFYFKN